MTYPTTPNRFLWILLLVFGCKSTDCKESRTCPGQSGPDAGASTNSASVNTDGDPGAGGMDGTGTSATGGEASTSAGVSGAEPGSSATAGNAAADNSGGGGSSGDEGDTTPEACSSNETRCGSSCVDTQTSRGHCGGCDQACGDDEVCNLGECQSSCDAALVECSGSCVDVDADPDHCGACNVACPVPSGGSAICNDGSCGLECSDRTPCDDACVNTQTSADHCGGCGEACDEDEVCNQGSCETSCDASLSICGGSCVDQDLDIEHCGSCDNECPVPGGGMATCDSGSCGIECDGLTPCQGACVDTMTDNANCGGCQNACNGECLNGTCCPADREVCGDSCVDLDSSAEHCGSCGNDCDSGDVCEDGECLVECLNGERCGNDCVDLDEDLQNCGGCGDVCAPPPANGSPICDDGDCAIECNANSLPCGNTCCDPAPSAAVEVTCNSSTCGVQCASGYHSCIGGSPSECFQNSDKTKCGSNCNDCRQTYASSSCSGGECNNTCTSGIDIGCEEAPGMPVCGFWGFETSASDTEGWYLDEELSDAATGVFGVSSQNATKKSQRSLRLGYSGNGTQITADARVDLCGDNINLSSRDFVFDLTAVASSGPDLTMGNTGGYILWWSGTSALGNCDFYFEDGLNEDITCPSVPAGAITGITIRPRVWTTWSGTFYIDNIRFE